MRTVLPQIVELYEIIADTIHTLTTSREPVLWRGAEWTPAAVERGELRGSVDGKAATVTLTACMDTAHPVSGFTAHPADAGEHL